MFLSKLKTFSFKNISNLVFKNFETLLSYSESMICEGKNSAII